MEKHADNVEYAWTGSSAHENVPRSREQVRVVDIGRGYKIEYRVTGAPTWQSYQNGKVFSSKAAARKTAVQMMR